MNTKRRNHFKEISLRRDGLRTGRTAFTLVELLVIIAVLAVLSSVLLPALCRAKAQPKVTACMSNYRQWAVSVCLYAVDNHDSLPSFPNPNGGGWMWDVSTSFVPVMGQYGMTVPMWFCPARPNEYNNLCAAFLTKNGRPLVSIDDLNLALTQRANLGETLLYDNWWVPRYRGGLNAPAYPGPNNNNWYPCRIPGAAYNNTSDSGYDWPVKTTDRAALKVPFISDECYSGGTSSTPPATPADTKLSDIRTDTAHFFNGVLDSVNAAYVDGRVETRRPGNIAARQPGADKNTVWFY